MVVEIGLHLRFSALKLRPRFCTAIELTEALTYYSVLAQLVEQLTVNQRVAGSSPADGAISFNDLHTFQLTSCFPMWGFCGGDFARTAQHHQSWLYSITVTD